jgi:hypothetical protein
LGVWQNGYAAFSVSESNVESVTAYLVNQAGHHKNAATRRRFVRSSNATGSLLTNAMFGIEMPLWDRTPLQGASFDWLHPGLKRLGYFLRPRRG